MFLRVKLLNSKTTGNFPLVRLRQPLIVSNSFAHYNSTTNDRNICDILTITEPGPLSSIAVSNYKADSTTCVRVSLRLLVDITCQHTQYCVENFVDLIAPAMDCLNTTDKASHVTCVM